MIEILTIINTCILIYILSRKHFRVHRWASSHKDVLTGFSVQFKGKRVIYIPIRNHRKTELKENINRMIADNEQSRRQTLNAFFSWITTPEDAEQFKKDYSIVDRAFVQELVNGFEPESNH